MGLTSQAQDEHARDWELEKQGLTPGEGRTRQAEAVTKEELAHEIADDLEALAAERATHEPHSASQEFEVGTLRTLSIFVRERYGGWSVMQGLEYSMAQRKAGVW